MNNGPSHLHKLKQQYAGDAEGLQRAIAVHLNGGPIDNLPTYDMKRLLWRERQLVQA